VGLKDDARTINIPYFPSSSRTRWWNALTTSAEAKMKVRARRLKVTGRSLIPHRVLYRTSPIIDTRAGSFLDSKLPFVYRRSHFLGWTF